MGSEWKSRKDGMRSEWKRGGLECEILEICFTVRTDEWTGEKKEESEGEMMINLVNVVTGSSVTVWFILVC